MMTSATPVKPGVENELDTLRQILLLSCGPDDPVFRQIDQAIESASEQRMLEALKAFDQLPQERRNRKLGYGNDVDIPCTDQ